jgi:hypothetical protein
VTFDHDDRIELDDLLDDLAIGPLTSQQRARLNELLLGNESAQEVFLDYWDVHTALTYNALARPAAFDVEQVVKSLQNRKITPDVEAVLSRDAQLSHVEPSPSRPRSPVLGSLGPVGALLSRPLVWSIALVALVSYGGFALVAWNLRPDKRSSMTVGNDTPIAVINDTTDVQWSKTAASKSAKSPVLAGEPLKIDSGVMELLLSAGTTLRVEGPAELRIDGDNSATLHAGKLMGVVPSKAIGFTLQTPNARIVDLGTEFLVEADEQGTTEVQVVKGKVALHPGNGADATNAQLPTTLVAGQARRVEPIGETHGLAIVEIKPIANQFVRIINPPSTRRLVVRGAFASSEYADRRAQCLIDGSGMEGDKHTNLAGATMWLTGGGKAKGSYVLFDFGRPCRIEAMKVWNYNESLASAAKSRGIKQADIYVSTTGKGDPLQNPNDWQIVVADQKFSAATGGADYATPDTIEFSPVEGRFMGIVVDEKLGPEPMIKEPGVEVVGLSEVQFFGKVLPKPSSRGAGQN